MGGGGGGVGSWNFGVIIDVCICAVFIFSLVFFSGVGGWTEVVCLFLPLLVLFIYVCIVAA